MSQNISSPSSPPSPFQSLPTEVRLQIFRHLLVVPNSIKTWQIQQDPHNNLPNYGLPKHCISTYKTWCPRKRPELHPDILRVCRVFRHECEKVLYGENTVDIHVTQQNHPKMNYKRWDATFVFYFRIEQEDKAPPMLSRFQRFHLRIPDESHVFDLQGLIYKLRGPFEGAEVVVDVEMPSKERVGFLGRPLTPRPNPLNSGTILLLSGHPLAAFQVMRCKKITFPRIDALHWTALAALVESEEEIIDMRGVCDFADSSVNEHIFDTYGPWKAPVKEEPDMMDMFLYRMRAASNQFDQKRFLDARKDFEAVLRQSFESWIGRFHKGHMMWGLENGAKRRWEIVSRSKF